MNKRPLISLAVVPLLALATIGLVAALWSETLTVEGDVATADFDAGWTLARCVDFDGFDMGEVWVPEADPSGAIAGLDNITFMVDGAYPTYEADCVMEYTYIGSIPARVEHITFDEGGLTGCVVTQAPTGQLTADCDQMEVTWVDGLCQNLLPNDTLAGNLRIAVKQAVDQNTTYGFQVGVEIQQLTDTACPS